MIGAALQRFAILLAVVGGAMVLYADAGGVLLVAALPIGLAGFGLECYQFYLLGEDD